MNDELMRFIIARLLEAAKEAHNEAAKDPKDEFSKGQNLGYYCAIDTIKSELAANGLDLKEYGLDINIEKELL